MDLGRRLRLRTLTHVAGEVIPFFWPMRNFIHHNPLHELEHLPFDKAVEEGKRVFGGRGFLRRRDYRRLYERGVIKGDRLKESIRLFLKERSHAISGIDLPTMIFEILTSPDSPRPYSNLYLHSKSPKPPRSLIDHFYEEPVEVVRDFLSSVGYERTLPQAIDVLTGLDLVSEIEERFLRGVFAFLDEGNATASMPSREKGLYRSWLEVFYRGKDVYEYPEEAIERVLRDLGIPESLWESYITLELGSSKGVAGFVRWRSSSRDYYWQNLYPADIVDLTAIKLLIERDVLLEHSGDMPFDPDLSSLRRHAERNYADAFRMIEESRRDAPLELLERCGEVAGEYPAKKALVRAQNFMIFLQRALDTQGVSTDGLDDDVVLELALLYEELEREEGFIWLRALEESLIEDTVGRIRLGGAGSGTPLAQFLFCIDVRSERIRKAIEESGRYETYGIAGFFGVPMAFVELRRGHEEFLCPVLIRPRNVVLEVPGDGTAHRGSAIHIFEKILHDLKANVLTPFITVEAVGFLFGFDFIGKTFFPYRYGSVRNRVLSEPSDAKIRIDKLTEEEIEGVIRLMGVDEEQKPYLRESLSFVGFSREEQANLIAKALQSIGLTENFARYVLVVGHESRSDNNPYESALDCGACGGSSGIYNARVFCMMANDLGVRQLLRDRYSIDVPAGTTFIPAVHNTTTDEITLYDVPSGAEGLDPIIEDIRKASQKTARRRAVDLEDEGVKARAYDWSQVRPEWGLSGNYAFIVGRRELTAGSGFEGKVFLHSYDWRVDRTGFLLETILSGPLIVGQWINMEHYFSTTDNEVYGSSSKVYHNVVGRFGVMTGNLSDLRTGLPLQTVWRRDEPYHLPVRLITIIEAPFEFARGVIERVYQVRMLVENGWINLLIVDPVQKKVWRFAGGEWIVYMEDI